MKHKPTSIADVIGSANKPDVTAADISAQPLAERNPILGYIIAASANIHDKSRVAKAQARNSGGKGV